MCPHSMARNPLGTQHAVSAHWHVSSWPHVSSWGPNPKSWPRSCASWLPDTSALVRNGHGHGCDLTEHGPSLCSLGRWISMSTLQCAKERLSRGVRSTCADFTERKDKEQAVGDLHVRRLPGLAEGFASLTLHLEVLNPGRKACVVELVTGVRGVIECMRARIHIKPSSLGMDAACRQGNCASCHATRSRNASTESITSQDRHNADQGPSRGGAPFSPKPCTSHSLRYFALLQPTLAMRWGHHSETAHNRKGTFNVSEEMPQEMPGSCSSDNVLSERVV